MKCKKGGYEMKKIKMLLAMLLCMALVMGSLSACKKSEDAGNDQDINTDKPNTEDNSNTEEPTGTVEELKEIDFSEHKEYTWWLYSDVNDYYSSYDDNPVVWYLNDKFNMTLKYEQPPAGTESDALNLMMGTGEYTDLIDVTQYTGSVSNLYEDGVIINIADYLDYMPNYKKLLEENETFRKNTYDDEGRILRLTNMFTGEKYQWGGMVYRYDILDTMTGGNPQFPSGNDEPTTIEDWDYMLPLFKQYFVASGMAEYAPLIIPSTGVFYSDDLVGSFGASATYYVDNGKIKFGPTEDGYYEFLKKMKEWYEAGYIYKDFASRVNDKFFLPNTALTYGGAAGIWFGLTSQVGDAMSMPDYGLYFDVRAIKNPINPEIGVTTAPNNLFTGPQEDMMGVVVTAKCEDIERLLSTIDFMYSEEGSYVKGYGLDKEHGSADNPIYTKYGLEEGMFSKEEDGSISFNKQLDFMGGPLTKYDKLIGNRIPSLTQSDYSKMMYTEAALEANEKWTAYQADDHKMPVGLTRSSEEGNIYTTNQTNIDDYVNTMVAKFIMGTEELNDATWTDFKAQLIKFGLEDNLAIQLAAYERYLVR